MANSHASFWEAVAGAAQSLRSAKLRTFLTLLGIILATTTLIAVMSVISGMDVYIAKNVSSSVRKLRSLLPRRDWTAPFIASQNDACVFIIFWTNHSGIS